MAWLVLDGDPAPAPAVINPAALREAYTGVERRGYLSRQDRALQAVRDLRDADLTPEFMRSLRAAVDVLQK